MEVEEHLPHLAAAEDDRGGGGAASAATTTETSRRRTASCSRLRTVEAGCNSRLGTEDGCSRLGTTTPDCCSTDRGRDETEGGRRHTTARDGWRRKATEVERGRRK
ncbi:lipopolysaccharide-responsive and beige-like, partial [Sesbania bispinosa]